MLNSLQKSADGGIGKQGRAADRKQKPDYIMILSPEQQILIERRAAADSPSLGAAYSLWLIAGLFGGHRFYLRQTKTALLLAALTAISISLILIGLLIGGTPLDGLFYTPSLDDILRSAQTQRGAILFYCGAALAGCAFIIWLADGLLLRSAIARRRAAERQKLIDFYQDY